MDSISYPVEVETGGTVMLPCESPPSRIDRQCDGNQGYAHCVRTCVVGSGSEAIRGRGIIEERFSGGSRVDVGK